MMRIKEKEKNYQTEQIVPRETVGRVGRQVRSVFLSKSGGSEIAHATTQHTRAGGGYNRGKTEGEQPKPSDSACMHFVSTLKTVIQLGTLIDLGTS